MVVEWEISAAVVIERYSEHTHLIIAAADTEGLRIFTILYGMWVPNHNHDQQVVRPFHLFG